LYSVSAGARVVPSFAALLFVAGFFVAGLFAAFLAVARCFVAGRFAARLEVFLVAMSRQNAKSVPDLAGRSECPLGQ
jgi:p-aminobenzoyl-glutamate transporter AbgT